MIQQIAQHAPGSAEYKLLDKILGKTKAENDHYAQAQMSLNSEGDTAHSIGQQVTAWQKNPEAPGAKEGLSQFYDNTAKMERQNAYNNAHPDEPTGGLVEKKEPPMYSTGYQGMKIMNPDYVSWSNSRAVAKNEPMILEQDNIGRVSSVVNPEYRDPKTGRNSYEEYQYQHSSAGATERLRDQYELRIKNELARGNYGEANAMLDTFRNTTIASSGTTLISTKTKPMLMYMAWITALQRGVKTYCIKRR